MRSKTPLVDLIARYVLKQKGKKIRPLLVMLAAKTQSEVNERSYRGAILVELLHTATLVHDDVVDNADQRRGFPSINAVWKNKVAVLMGDYLLSKGLMISVENKDFDFLEVMTDTVRRMSEGELLQIQKTRKLDIDEETYYKVISDKTASLLETCCEIGAMSAGASPEERISMKKFGEYLGISFQIRDDILDYEGTSKVFGKPIGGDIKEKKITLPLIYALRSVSKSQASDIRKLIKKEGKKDSVRQVIDFVHEQKGIEYAEAQAEIFAGKAKDCLKIFQDTPAKESLISLVDFVVQRKN
ncbi:MAG: polyprenyl synthetase family protein [Ignavibacteriales bacterium]|nr:MAG: polyprenyl synthetase family protein [Ignavibacteriales bacterium]